MSIFFGSFKHLTLPSSFKIPVVIPVTILMRAKYIGCIGTHVHGRQVLSLLCQSDVIITCRISAYSGTSRSLFLRIKCGI